VPITSRGCIILRNVRDKTIDIKFTISVSLNITITFEYAYK
jgi:hypothetical protein